MPVFFAFDLDGTVTTRELLPCIAQAAGLADAMAELTARTLAGLLPFAESLRHRVALLAQLPLASVHERISSVPLDPDISAFIRSNTERCAIVTGNLDVWISPMVSRLGCPLYCSRAEYAGGGILLHSILDKGDAVSAIRRNSPPGVRVIAIGESVGDIPMFQAADTGIAYAGVHEPAPGLRRFASHTARNGRDLCRLLQTLLENGGRIQGATPDRARCLDGADALV